jgi:poly-gamma-glutamate synthesis protein (capsule biosynthesis protein)
MEPEEKMSGQSGGPSLENDRVTTIAIGGDLCPVFRAEELFIRGDVAAIFSDLASDFGRADLSIANLECPLVMTPSPVNRAGPVLGASAMCIKGIAGAGIGVLNLANNHVLDHGAQGLSSTIETCAQAGLAVFGAGRSLEEAGAVLVREVNGVRVGMLGLAQHEFSTAGPKAPGANPIDLRRVFRSVSQGKGSWDFLIMLVHAGTEGYPYPSPRLVELCRTLVEIGAGLVVCQHSHCPGCYEAYLGSLIVYGQGNLIFDWVPNPGGPWNQGFLVKVVINGARLRDFELIPHCQSVDSAGATRMGPGEAAALLAEVEARSREIAEPGAVERLWREHCLEAAGGYYQLLLGNRFRHRIARALFERLGLDWHPMDHRRRLLLGNLLRCEDHREALETILLGADVEDSGDERG